MARPDTWNFSMNFLGSPEAEEIEKYVAQLEKNASRYEWLRAQFWESSKICAVTNPKNAIKLGYYAPSGTLLDDFIDGLMKQEGN